MPKSEFVCANCKNHFWDYTSNRARSKSGNTFCSRKCKGQYQTKQALACVPQKTHSKCNTCDETKSVSKFYRDVHCRANGYVQYDCKECIKRKRRDYYDVHRETVIARVREYAAGHPEVARRYYTKHKGRQTKQQRQARAKLNRELQAGRITRPIRCEMCARRRKLHAHHTDGYELENALKVRWICVRCHHESHSRGPNCR